MISVSGSGKRIGKNSNKNSWRWNNMAFFKNWRYMKSYQAWKKRKESELKKTESQIKQLKESVKSQLEDQTNYNKAWDNYMTFVRKKSHLEVKAKTWIRNPIHKLIDIFKPKPLEMLVRMKQRNGDKVTFIVDINKPYFFFEGGAYVVDERTQEWNATQRLYESFYHQDIAFPFREIIDVASVKKQLESSDQGDVDLSSNPYVLKKFIESEFVQKVAQGADINKELGFLKTMLIICLIGIAIIIIMFIVHMKK
jgi:hypothetical protein